MVSSPVVSCPVVNGPARLVRADPSCYRMHTLSQCSTDRRDTEMNRCRFQGGGRSPVHPSCKREGVSVPRPQASRDRGREPQQALPHRPPRASQGPPRRHHRRLLLTFLPTQKRFEVRNSNLPNPQSVSSSSDNSPPIGNRKSAIGNKVNKAPTSPITRMAESKLSTT